MKILHLTPHLGGGVGAVLRAFLSYESTFIDERVHSLCSLEDINQFSRDFLRYNGVTYTENLYYNQAELSRQVESSDIVVVHWWNHPLLQELLMNYQLPPNRMIIWCHISGLTSPNVVCEYILELPDEFIFTTPLSNFVPCIESYRKSKDLSFHTIWSTCGYESIEKLYSPQPRRNFGKRKTIRLGYVGNLDQTKLSADFFNILSKIESSEVHTTVIGPPTEFFLNMLEESNNENVEYLGFVSEEEKFRYLNSFDIFFYPLARNHYGTCDQAIQEAMIFGIPVIAFNNPMESYMIKHGETGLIAKNSAEFAKLLQELIDDEFLRSRLSIQASKAAKEMYSVEQMANSWCSMFESALLGQKTLKAPLSQIMGRKLSPAEIMATSLGIYGGLFSEYLESTEPDRKLKLESQISALASSPNWTSPTKSTVHHYKKFFDDEIIALWSKLML